MPSLRLVTCTKSSACWQQCAQIPVLQTRPRTNYVRVTLHKSVDSQEATTINCLVWKCSLCCLLLKSSYCDSRSFWEDTQMPSRWLPLSVFYWCCFRPSRGNIWRVHPLASGPSDSTSEITHWGVQRFVWNTVSQSSVQSLLVLFLGDGEETRNCSKSRSVHQKTLWREWGLWTGQVNKMLGPHPFCLNISSCNFN